MSWHLAFLVRTQANYIYLKGLRRSPYTPSSTQLPQSKGVDYRASLGSTRPTTTDIVGKLSEQKRWVEEFSRSVPHRSTSANY